MLMLLIAETVDVINL